jgi:hypothetical protein
MTVNNVTLAGTIKANDAPMAPMSAPRLKTFAVVIAISTK